MGEKRFRGLVESIILSFHWLVGGIKWTLGEQLKMYAILFVLFELIAFWPLKWTALIAAFCNIFIATIILFQVIVLQLRHEISNIYSDDGDYVLSLFFD